jgi:two-component system, NarL family, nitrate/nitrite response regulator NarL
VSSSNLSLIVADDHPLMRAGIKEVLSADRLYNLIAIAQTGAECLEIMQRFRPDVALIDIDISQPGAAHILREVKSNRWQTRICFLTGNQIPPDVLEAGKDRAIFINERFPDDLRNRLREIAVDLVGRTSATPNSPAAIPAPAGWKRPLTFRQKQIVTMLQVGSSNREIARVLGVSEGTIKVHLHRIFQRVGVANRTQLAAQAFAAEDTFARNRKSGESRKI